MIRENVPRSAGITVEVSGAHNQEEMVAIAAGTLRAVTSVADALRSRGGAIPGEFPAWDDAAWERLEQRVGRCDCGSVPGPDCPLANHMLVYHETPDRAIFVNCLTDRRVHV